LTACLNQENSISFYKTSQSLAVIFNSNKSFIKGKKVTKIFKKIACLNVKKHRKFADQKSDYSCRTNLEKEKSVYSRLEKAEETEDRVYETRLDGHVGINPKFLIYYTLFTLKCNKSRDGLVSKILCDCNKIGSPVGAGKEGGGVCGCVRMPDRRVYSEYRRHSRLSDIAYRIKFKSEPRGQHKRKIVTSLLSRVRTAISCLCNSVESHSYCCCFFCCCYVVSFKVKFSVLTCSESVLEISNHFRSISQIFGQAGDSLAGMSERAGSLGRTVSCVVLSQYNGG